MSTPSAQWLQQASKSQRRPCEEEGTPSTSASSSPRQVPLPAPCGLLGLPQIAPGDGILRLEDLLTSSTLEAMSTGASSSPREELVLPPLGLAIPSRIILPPLVSSLPVFQPPPGLPHPPNGVPRNSQPLPTAVPTEASVEWRIQKVFSRLKTSAGFALVSPPLQLGDISDVRLQFSPGEGWAASARNPKSKATHMRPEGKSKGRKDSEHGTVSLKLGDAARGETLKCYLFVGRMRQGPFECNFAEQVVHELQLKVDWRKYLEAGSLPLCLQFVHE